MKAAPRPSGSRPYHSVISVTRLSLSVSDGRLIFATTALLSVCLRCATERSAAFPVSFPGEKSHGRWARVAWPAVQTPMPNHANHRTETPSTPSLAWFTRFAKWTAFHAGRPSAFLVAFGVIIAWAVTGPMFGYSDTWQLVINTGTTIVTFLMVFLIQNTQNRDSQAIHVKLDELIRSQKGARNALLNLEDLSDEELEQLRVSFNEIAQKAKHGPRNGNTKTQTDVIAITRKK